ERQSAHDRNGSPPYADEERERRAHDRRAHLGEDQERAAVKAVGSGTGPGREQDDADEHREVGHADEERTRRQPVDKQRLRDDLEPGAAVRSKVANEVEREVALAQDTEGGAG